NDLAATECPEPARCLRGEKRIWVVVEGNVPDPLQGLPATQAAALQGGYKVSAEARPTGLTVSLLVRTS
ncbi:hypothetical protein ACFRI7_38510, partial [Streptomyces sp. NPDC056716]